jgi:hypothetical protein
MRLLAAFVAAGVLASAAQAAAPATHLTAAGEATARASLLTTKVMGAGWSAAAPVATAGLELSCAGYDPSTKGIVEVGRAEQPDLKGGTAGPIISQVTAVYATAAQASALWKRAVTPRLVVCAREALEGVAAKGIKTKVLSQGMLAVPKAPATTAAYRVVADLVSKTQTLKTYFDVIIVRRAKTLSEITVATFLHPVSPADVEGALATIVYHAIG